jgi:hypothetical protein
MIGRHVYEVLNVHPRAQQVVIQAAYEQALADLAKKPKPIHGKPTAEGRAVPVAYLGSRLGNGRKWQQGRSVLGLGPEADPAVVRRIVGRGRIPVLDD